MKYQEHFCGDFILKVASWKPDKQTQRNIKVLVHCKKIGYEDGRLT
jgi:hypothetical protein